MYVFVECLQKKLALKVYFNLNQKPKDDTSTKC